MQDERFSYVQDWNRKLRELGWWHSFELPDGTLVEGVCSLDGLKRRLAQFPIPYDLTGKRVLDIGAWDGFFTFEMEKRGAEVLAIDCWDNERFRVMRQMMNSRVDYRIYDMYELTPATVGKFDIVIFFGVLYHLKHPLLALERVCALTKELACVDTFVIDDADPRPRMEFYEHDELGGQTDNWVGPNIPCLLAWCRTAGFARVEFRGKLEHSACVACYREWEPVEPGAPDPPEVSYVMHDRNFGLNFRSDLDEYVGVTFAAPAATVSTTKPAVSGYGAVPISVTQTGSGLYQANFKLPPGLEPGWHDVTLRLADSAPSAPHRIAVDMPVKVDSIRIASIAENGTWTAGQVRKGHSAALWVEGLPENADVANVEVRLANRPLTVEYARDGQVNATIPEDTPAGEHAILVSIAKASTTAKLVVI